MQGSGGNREVPPGSTKSRALELMLFHEHAARLAAFVARDDPAALEHVDQASRPRVANPQAALTTSTSDGLFINLTSLFWWVGVLLARVEALRRPYRPRIET